MHKSASKKTGGSNLSGWSVGAISAPHDYRAAERKTIARLGKNGADKLATERYVRGLIKLIVAGKPIPDAPMTLPMRTRAAIKRAGGVVAWAVKRASVRNAFAGASPENGGRAGIRFQQPGSMTT